MEYQNAHFNFKPHSWLEYISLSTSRIPSLSCRGGRFSSTSLWIDMQEEI
jgi:hypothetical protein